MASSSSAQAAPPATTTDEADIDAEMVQSTVDISLSLALSLVQSWMPPASFTPLDQSVVQSRKKLEEYMRRPPRLGVGTPIPTTQNTQSTYHETQKLKNKLVGSGTARRKAEEETKLNGAGSKRPGNNNSDEEDESESRASAMRKKQTRTGINGLSVFGGGKGGKDSKPNFNTETLPQSRDDAVPATSSTAPSARERTPPAPTSPTCSFSSTTKASPEPTAATEADTGTRSSPHAEPPAIQGTPDELMGIHKLPAKLPLAAKIWPQSQSQSQSPPQSKRRKTLTAMRPPPSPSHTWSMVLPRLPLSSSASESVASSSVPSSSAATDTGLDSTARLSRKERKRLRKAAQQTEVQTQENAAYDHEGRGRDSVSGCKSQDACATPPDISVVAMKATSTPRSRPTEADSDDSDGDDDESEEMVSRASEEHRVVAQDDTMQDGGKKKRKRRARKKPGPG
ncbi:unnamed protein product [Rhizoctonia solani]|uniref:DUF3245 family protein n=1 Tax=Rhizoctonia solani AG-3 Rhs1AP TaxID=1086054 RepID=X8JTA4_9AGAM|nr:DUF3245 family protein [Rhizoctonia solani AG-3 Rhs1AP]CAE6520231.1 unnamed protein product [Rhizoctonia solani]